MLKKILLSTTALVLAVSCSPDDELFTQVELTTTELNSVFGNDSPTATVDDVLSAIYLQAPFSATATMKNECYEVAYSALGFFVNFTNCEINGVANINGEVRVVYEEDSNASAFRAIFIDFEIGDTIVNGTRILSTTAQAGSDNAITYSITSDMSILLASGDTILESGTRIFNYVTDGSMNLTSYKLTGDWTLVKDRDTYEIKVMNPLSGNASCSYMTQGSMTIIKNGLSVLLDLGDGTCDNLATIIYPDETQVEIQLGD